jgi:hypothetical protein
MTSVGVRRMSRTAPNHVASNAPAAIAQIVAEIQHGEACLVEHVVPVDGEARVAGGRVPVVAFVGRQDHIEVLGRLSGGEQEWGRDRPKQTRS